MNIAEQRELFITAKRPKLKLSRYEHLKSTKWRENINLSCVDQTLSQPTVNIQFLKQWTRLPLFECQKHLKLLKSDYNYTLDQLQSSWPASTMTILNIFRLRSFANLSILPQLTGSTRQKRTFKWWVCFSRSYSTALQHNFNVTHTSNRPQYSVTVNISYNDDYDNFVNTSVNHPTSETLT